MRIEFKHNGRSNWQAFSPLFVCDLDPIDCISSGRYALFVRRRIHGRATTADAVCKDLGAAKIEAERLLRVAEERIARQDEMRVSRRGASAPDIRQHEFVDYERPGIDTTLRQRAAAFARRWQLRQTSHRFVEVRVEGKKALSLRVTFEPLAIPEKKKEAASC